MPKPIDDPLLDLMLSMHGCVPGCGCGADFQIDAKFIGGWIDDFGEDFAREALCQIDDLLAYGRDVEAAVSGQLHRWFRPPETVTAWLERWRAAIEQALRDFLADDVPPVRDAEAARSVARDARDAARRRWTEREQRAIAAARQDQSWCAAEQVRRRALRRLPKAKRAGDAGAVAKLRAASESAQAAMDAVEEACRAQDPEHATAARGLRAAESALFEAERRLRRTIARTGTARNQLEPPHIPQMERTGRNG